MNTRRFRFPLLLTAFAVFATLLVGADGCASDPDVEGAKLYIRQGDYQQAISNLDRALQRNPDNAQALLLKAQALTSMVDREMDPLARRPMVNDIDATLARALTVNPAASEEILTQRRQAWANELNKGVQAYQAASGDVATYVRASEFFLNATTLVPDSANGHFFRGLTLLAADRTAEAQVPLEMAIEKGEQSADAFRYLALIYAQGNEDLKALDVLDRGIALDSTDEGLVTERVNALQRMGRGEEAMSTYRDLITANPDNPLYHFNYGTLLLNAEQYEAAIEQLVQAVELYDATSEPNPKALFNLGAAYQNKSVRLNEQSLADGLSQAEQDRLQAERIDLLNKAVTPYTRARELTEAAGESAANICNALFQVYGQLRRNDDAREAAACAGINLN